MAKPIGIASGDMRHRCVLQQYVSTGTDDRGQPTGAWTDISIVWCSIKPLSGRAIEFAHQLYDVATLSVRTRYISTITKDMRLKYGTRILPIGYVKNVDELNTVLEMLCSEEL